MTNPENAQPYQGLQAAYQPAYSQSDQQHYAGGGYPQPGQPAQGYPRQGYPQPGSAQPGYAQYPASDPTAVVGARVGQYIVDGLLAAVPIILLWFLAMGAITAIASSSYDVESGGYSNDAGAMLGSLFMGAIALLAVLSIVIQWLVFAWWPSRHGGQTIAMRWFKLRIITEDGGQPTLGALSLRWLLLIVDGFFGGLVGLLIMVNSARHQRLGDSVAKTLVVRVD
jgi:uncharacterized RDD family membrane protein YckC